MRRCPAMHRRPAMRRDPANAPPLGKCAAARQRAAAR